MGVLVQLSRATAWWGRGFSSPPAARLGATMILCFSSAASDALGARPPTPHRVGNGRAAASTAAAAAAAAAGVAATSRRGATGTRTGVLIHGCHLGAKGWRSVMWGDEKGQRLGRLPHAVRLAWEENACVVTIGTGASEKDGVQEGRYALQYLLSNWDRLREFPAAFAGVDLQEVREFIEPLLIAEGKSHNTREELLEAGRIFRREKCNRVILVSSPTHVPRCLRDACSLWQGGASPAIVSTTATTAAYAGDAMNSYPRLRKDEARENVDDNIYNNINDDDRVSREGHAPTAAAVGKTETDAQTSESRVMGPDDGGTAPRHLSLSYPGDTRDDRQQEGEKKEEEVPLWEPVILASPCDTSYAGYGPDDLAIVEPPHRGDDPALSVAVPRLLPEANGQTSGKAGAEKERASRDGCDDDRGKYSQIVGLNSGTRPRDWGGGEEGVVPPLLHELVGRALRVPRGEESAKFRQELDALLRRYLP